MIEIDDAMINHLENQIGFWYFRGKKVALVGELNKLRTKNTLAYKVKHKLKAKSVKVFTRYNPFTIQDGKDFDVIIGVRPCDGTETILDSAIEYKKKAYVLLCQCGGFKKMLLKLLPKCTKCDIVVQANSPWGWPVLSI